jgi:diguanylate cyclase (GGDEF)-like protein/PAS domain S-box-containing protein
VPPSGVHRLARLGSARSRYIAPVEEGERWVTRCPVPACAIDARNSIVAWNEAASRLLSWKAHDVLGRPLVAIAAPGSASALEQFVVDVVAGEQHGIDVELRRQDGSRVPAHLDGGLLREPGEVPVVVAVVTDLTSSVAASDDAKREAERLRALMHNVSDTITVLDQEANVVFLGGNPGGTLGYDDAALHGASALDHLHPDDLERIAAEWARLLAAPGAEVRTEYRVGTASGGWEYADATAVNLLHDPLIGGILLTSRNITDRKRNELLLAAQASSLARLIEGAPISEVIHGIQSALHELLPEAIVAVVGAEPVQLLTDPVPFVPHGYRNAIEAWKAHAGPPMPDGGTILCLDTGADEAMRELDHVLRPHGYTCAWVLPLVAARGARWIGHLLVHLPTAREPDEADRKVLDALRGLALIAIEHGRAEWLAREALYDSLTGLPNRTLIRDRLGRALAKRERDGTVVGLIFFDLDNFKVINDSLGHAAGDELLRVVARRLESAVRPGDSVGRLGGDEFVVVCDTRADEDVIGVAARIVDAFGAPFMVGHTERYVSASFGIALARRGDDDPEALLRDADAAMYHAKERGRARYEVFDDSMRVRALERLSLETSLRGAAARDEFRLHYQPIIEFSTGSIVGAEALLRWVPHHGRVVPAKDFIDLAESTGVITGIAPWVFREACAVAGRWQLDPGGARLSVAVNLSARQLTDPQVVTQLGRAIDVAGVDPTAICIEVTEHTLMENEVRTTGVLAALKDLGVRLAIDDFGTGYSSLSYLRHLPVDVVKVDRSFVDGLGRDVVDTRIMAAVIGLAHSLELEVVAEGVETEQQHAALLDLGCDGGQGYFWSTALAEAEFNRFVAGSHG